MVWYVGPAYGAEVDCVVFFELVEAIGGHVVAALLGKVVSFLSVDTTIRTGELYACD